MKHLSIALLLSLVVVFSCKKEEKNNTLAMGDFELSTDVVSRNKPITITYNGDDEEMEGFYYLLNGYRSYPKDLNFENGKATITIPDSIAAIALNLRADGKYLHNEKQGYIFAVNNADGTAVLGSKSSIENYKLGNGQNYGVEGNADALVEALETEVNTNPELKEAWKDRYLNTMFRNSRKKGEAIAESTLKELAAKKELTEKDYGKMLSIYRMMRKSNLADSITKIAIAKFPNGKIHSSQLMNDFFDAKDLDKKEDLYNKIKTADPENRNLNYAMSNLASSYYAKGNKEKFNTFANQIENLSDKAGLYNSIAWDLAEKGKDLEFASQISKQSLKHIEDSKTNMKDKPTYYTKNQFKSNLESSYNMFADTYALIQFKLGNIKEAVKYQGQAIGKGKDPQLNARYIEFLLADQQFDLASKKANEFLNEGHANSKITEYYKTAYMKVNPDTSTEDFDAIIADIKEKSRQKELADLKESMLDEDAPQFVLKNLDGDNVSLTDLKGKTVILDFWATWCGPCKASFPGMQEVVKKYKDDENVVLLFVDTFEDGANREKNVAKFISDNKYDFHVLIDGKVKDTDNYEVANKYGITGIPTKVIIGPSGKINFKSVGFSGSNDKLKQEMDLMIELLKS